VGFREIWFFSFLEESLHVAHGPTTVTPGEAHLLRNLPGGLNIQFYNRRHGNEGDKKAGITPLCQCPLQLFVQRIPGAFIGRPWEKLKCYLSVPAPGTRTAGL
jgi:hypothetical protein